MTVKEHLKNHKGKVVIQGANFRVELDIDPKLPSVFKDKHLKAIGDMDVWTWEKLKDQNIYYVRQVVA
jgi:hypothetical protein